MPDAVYDAGERHRLHERVNLPDDVNVAKFSIKAYLAGGGRVRAAIGLRPRSLCFGRMAIHCELEGDPGLRSMLLDTFAKVYVEIQTEGNGAKAFRGYMGNLGLVRRDKEEDVGDAQVYVFLTDLRRQAGLLRRRCTSHQARRAFRDIVEEVERTLTKVPGLPQGTQGEGKSC